MTKEVNIEPVKITLEVYVSLKFIGNDLKITVCKDFIEYAGNLDSEIRSLPGPVSRIPITTAVFRELIGDISISRTVPEFVTGLDGTTYTISFENGSNKSVYRWWCDCPEGWQNLNRLMGRVITYIKKSEDKIHIV